jgi:DNA-3-methyladenine glycosylase
MTRTSQWLTSADARRLLARSPPEVARRLLGARLSHSTPEGSVTVELTEVEAYAGEVDPASHAFRGRTPRNGVMFGPAGVLYVYFSYGMHWCANVVTGDDGGASAVLLRAGRVVAGVELARLRRGPRIGDRSLARGPACLTQALGIRGDAYGTDLLDPTATVRLQIGPPLDPGRVANGPRVGVAAAAEVRWRFWVDGDPTVSAYQRSPRAAR